MCVVSGSWLNLSWLRSTVDYIGGTSDFIKSRIRKVIEKVNLVHLTSPKSYIRRPARGVSLDYRRFLAVIQATVNRLAGGSNPSRGATSCI